MTRWLPILAIFCLFSLPLSAQVPPEKALETFTVAEGLELSLFASEPMMVNPTCIDIDHKGRVWVCEAVNYRRKPFGRPILREKGDQILVLEDTDGDGKADKAHTFYQSPEIIAPLGVCVAPYPDGKGQKVYVCQSPNIWVFEDKDGDLKADGPPKVLLTGFRGVDHDHGVHSVMIGPDGKLYFTVGDSGVGNLQSSDGKGRKWTSNSTDVRAGTVWRCDLDGTNVELIAHNFRNNYECCVNSFGDIWLSDNDDDGNQQTRICYVMPGGNYGYHPRGPGQTHWHEEQPGVVHKVIRTGFGSPCGICFYEGSLLPKKYHGQLLHADAGPREIRCFHLKPKGAGFEAEKENLVTSRDNWFRPSDVCVAPDGSVFIADWYDPGVGGHGMGDWTRGRIYRLTPKGHKGYKVPDLKDDFARTLASPCQAVRAQAIARVNRANDEERNKLLGAALLGELKIFGPPMPPKSPEKEQEEALAQYRCFLLAATQFADVLKDWFDIPFKHPSAADVDVKVLVLFTRTNPNICRFLSARAWAAAVKKQTVAGREALLRLRNVSPEQATKYILELASQYDGNDRFYLNAIGIAVGTDPERRKVILADFEKHFPEWNDKVADLVWELRPPSMMGKMGKLLGDDKLTAAQKSRILDILAASDDLSAGKTMLDILGGDAPDEVRARAIENLRLHLPTKWNSLAKSDELGKAIRAMLNNPKKQRTGLELVAAAQYEPAVKAISDIVLEEQIPADVRLLAVKTLAKVRSLQSTETLDRVWVYGDSLALRTEAILGLGEHIVGKGDAPSSKKALESLQRIVQNKNALETWRAAVTALSGSQPGTVWLLELAEKKQLPPELVADAGRLLRNSPYQGLRNKAMLLFPAPGRINPKSLPPIAALVKRRGDVNRGKQVFVASLKNDMQCAKCHTVRGIGGQIGPDLSMIGKKASRENLLESILVPSKAVADQFINWQVETSKGLSLTGLIVEETPEHVLIRDGNGKDTKVLKKDIESRKKGEKSIMPEDLVVYLTEDDLLDLTEYMLTLKTASLTPPVWHIVGPFDNGEGDTGLDKVFPPEKEMGLSKAQFEGKSGKIGWRQVRPDSSGYVDLQKHYGPSGTQIVSYLYHEITSPADQEATILLGNDDGCKLFINGEKVFEDRRHIAATPESSTIKIKLKKGVNKVLLKINNGDGPHGFYFTVVAEQELK